MTGLNEHIFRNLPVLDDKYWDKWNVHMNAMFDFQDILDIVKSGYEPLDEPLIKGQR